MWYPLPVVTRRYGRGSSHLRIGSEIERDGTGIGRDRIEVGRAEDVLPDSDEHMFSTRVVASAIESWQLLLTQEATADP